MSEGPGRPHRRSIRLKEFDYRTPGLYVVTICVQHRLSLFGEISGGEMCCSPAGEMIQTTWNELPWAYPGVEIDAFVVMPNHIHGIVFLLPADNASHTRANIEEEKRFSLPDVVQRFKSLTTNRYGDGVRQFGWTPYDGRLWQRNYYEHIVRNEHDLQRFRRYITENPYRWSDDPHHPDASLIHNPR